MKLLCPLFILIFLASCQQSELEKKRKLSLKLPEFESKDVLSEKSYNRKSFVNSSTKAIFVHFWATWCGPCEAEFPEFIRFAKKWETKPVQFIAFAVNDKVLAIKKYLKKFGPLPKNMTILLDPDQLSLKFGTVKLPETYLMNSKGNYDSKYIGPQNWGADYYSQQIEKLILKN
jgi:cytochrome c biogenesis protein CcmG, thiol:disulfide interchange protein DsbE